MLTKYDQAGAQFDNLSYTCGLVQYNREKDTVKIGEEYYGEIIIATPPKTKSVIMISDFTTDSIGANHILFEGIHQKRIYNEKFNKAGLVKKIIFWAIEDSINGQIHKGKKVVNIFVRK